MLRIDEKESGTVSCTTRYPPTNFVNKITLTNFILKSKSQTFEDIIYEKASGMAKVTINRPHKRNAFRPQTVNEMIEAFNETVEELTQSLMPLVAENGMEPRHAGRRTQGPSAA